MIDINLDECTTSVDKIIMNHKLFNHSFKKHFISENNNTYTTIKCYKSLPSVTSLEIKGRNVIKIHKTIFLNLLNLVSIDLSENKLMKISKSFKLFTNLKTLKLNNNQISFIPTFIGELNQLEYLSLYKNIINSIPSSIQDLTKLKHLDLSYNKIENIPIEIGVLNSLNVLHIDCNYFTKIPTTLCYLKKLSDLSFDWLEFVNPPYYKNIKDSIGKIIINFIIKALQNLLKKGILFCDYQNFVEEMSIKKSNNDNNNGNIEPYDSLLNRSGINNELKNSQFCGSSVTIKSSNNNLNMNNKFLKIFNAIEGGYYGIIKSMLEGENVYEYLTIKNMENRTALSYCMSKNNDLIDLFLSKIKEQKIEINYTYLFKAIKLRNPELVKKLIYLGIKVDSIDDQGKGVLHILFSVFNKNLSKCILIGNFLLSFNLNLNRLDKEGWGPIHLAAKRASKECLLWIIEKNKKFRKEGKEEFDLNLKGKNDSTPLHLAVKGLRIEETVILLENGGDVFARNNEMKTPKQIGMYNYVFSKLLSFYENMALNNKYILKIKNNQVTSNKQIYSKIISKKKYNQKDEDVSSSFYDENLIINNSVTINSNIFQKTINTIKNVKNIKDINEKNKTKTEKAQKRDGQKINLLFSLKHNLFKEDNNDNFDNQIKASNITPDINRKINTQEKMEENDYNDKKPSKQYYIFEKVKYFHEIRLNNKCCDVDTIKNFIENISNEYNFNTILISDICSYAIENCFYEIIPSLKQLLTNKIIMNSNFIKKELEDTIDILEMLEKGQKNYNKNKEVNKDMVKNNNSLYKEENKQIIETEKDDTLMFRNTEMNEFDNIEKVNMNYEKIFLKTEEFGKENHLNDKNGNINRIRDVKLSKGNILNIDIKKIKYKNKNKKQYNKLGKMDFNKISKIKEIRTKK